MIPLRELKNGYTICSGAISVKDFERLRTMVGWAPVDSDAIAVSLSLSLFAVHIVDVDGCVCGMARLIGDRMYTYVQDMMVDPSHQHNGLGTAMMEELLTFISRNACEGGVVGLMAAVGAKDFYSRFGFSNRPTSAPGMQKDMSST